MAGQEIRVLIADDHPIFREGLKQVITRDPQLQLAGEASNGEEALALIKEIRPDVAVLDLNMPGTDGFGVLRAIQELGLAVKIIFLTMHDSKAFFNAALDLGAAGYVLKDGAIAEIGNAIRSVFAGRNYISPELSAYLLKRSARSAMLSREKPTLNYPTQTERRILKLIAEEKTSREIAAALFISVRTVEHHRAHICEKLDLRGFNSLVKFAIAHKSELS